MEIVIAVLEIAALIGMGLVVCSVRPKTISQFLKDHEPPQRPKKDKEK